MKSLMCFAVMAVLASGCSSAPQQSATDHSWNADFGKRGLDPVADKLIMRQTAVQRQYQGVTYYFQSEEEAREFESNPTAYVGSPSSAANSGEVRHQSSVHSR